MRFKGGLVLFLLDKQFHEKILVALLLRSLNPGLDCIEILLSILHFDFYELCVGLYFEDLLLSFFSCLFDLTIYDLKQEIRIALFYASKQSSEKSSDQSAESSEKTHNICLPVN